MVEQLGGNPGELTTFAVVADYRTRSAHVLTKSDAALFVARELGWPWKAMRVLALVPKGLRDRTYDLVARRRYGMFGRYDRCLVPRPEVRSRFID
jgi:predicted DCC family thiol-disulfide oxidoreductase YuxK